MSRARLADERFKAALDQPGPDMGRTLLHLQNAMALVRQARARLDQVSPETNLAVAVGE